MPASLGECTKLKTLYLHQNQLEGSVPASALAKLTAITQLALHINAGLTITPSGRQELRSALPNAELWLPTVAVEE